MTDLVSIPNQVKTIALVGASANPARPSHDVMAYLVAKGYDVIPINPGLAGDEILGQRVYASLKEIDRPVDMVEVFRKSEVLYQIAKEAIAIQAKVLWAQLGVLDEAAAALAQAAGLNVVMDRCPKIELEAA